MLPIRTVPVAAGFLAGLSGFGFGFIDGCQELGGKLRLMRICCGGGRPKGRMAVLPIIRVLV